MYSYKNRVLQLTPRNNHKNEIKFYLYHLYYLMVEHDYSNEYISLNEGFQTGK